MYYSIEEMLEMVDHLYNRKPCLKLLKENEALFKRVPGSTHNHQTWSGGYWDHIQEIMNIAIVIYRALDEKRTLLFTLGEVLLVVFLHDLEKPWAYESKPDGTWRRKNGFKTKEECHKFRMKKIKEYKIELLPGQENAIKYIEGEGNDYTNEKRVMNELAGLCHACDTISARVFWKYPLAKDTPLLGDDPWLGAERLKKSRRSGRDSD